MTVWRRWLERPQQTWVRRALVQIHLWVGVAAGLYVLTISVSGSAIVLRRELAVRLRHPVTVAPGPLRLSREELERRVQRAYPGYEIYNLRESPQPGRPDQVVLGNGERRIGRLFDPYTGADLGDPVPAVNRALGWLTDLHDNLLGGMTGRFVNGIGALLVTVLGLTGVVIWWPGIRNWRRSLTLHRGVRFARFNWDLHSAVGFWTSLLVLSWGISGMALCFPGVLNPWLSNDLIYWTTRLHFGRFSLWTEAIWTLLGLAPALLFVTGAVMWWNRVLRKKLR